MQYYVIHSHSLENIEKFEKVSVYLSLMYVIQVIVIGKVIV